MKVIVEAEGTRRFVNSSFRIYGSKEDLKIIADALLIACNGNLVQGWVNVGETLVKDETTFPYDATAVEKPIYPFTAKA